jgi:hypothetical protein
VVPAPGEGYLLKVSGQRVSWTKEQYEAYCKRTGTPSELAQPKGKAGRTAPRKGKNKTELEFEKWYRHRHPSLSLVYEAIKLRIDLTCWYLPDFYCPEQQIFIEVKGPYIYPDALIKFKAARAIHTWAKFSMWQKKKGIWMEVYALEES